MSKKTTMEWIEEVSPPRDCGCTLELGVERKSARKSSGSGISRVMDVVVALLFLPLALAMAAYKILWGARIERLYRSGLHGKTFTEYLLFNRRGLREDWTSRAVMLWNLLIGDVAIVGPRRRNADELSDAERKELLQVRPGLLCNWWLKRRSNVHYGTEYESDLAYIGEKSFKTDLSILLRGFLGLIYGAAKELHHDEVELLDLRIDNLTMDEALDRILDREHVHAPLQVSFLNVDCVNKSVSDPVYREILRTSGLRLGDGIGLRIGAKLCGTEIRQNVNGTDMFPLLCERLQASGGSIFLLGGKPGIAADVAAWVERHHPGVRIAGTQHGYFKKEAENEVVEQINASGAEVLLVAFGAPLQEKWIRKHLDKLKVTAALGVGGLFDFYSGRIPRAPIWMREAGLEWTYRLYQEPQRMWRRYLVGNFAFLWRVLVWRKKRGRRELHATTEANKWA